jgi:hypothetical protein
MLVLEIEFTLTETRHACLEIHTSYIVSFFYKKLLYNVIVMQAMLTFLCDFAWEIKN